MSTTMRPTLQTVPEALPADHVTTAAAPATTTVAAPSQPRPRPFKGRGGLPLPDGGSVLCKDYSTLFPIFETQDYWCPSSITP
ncbi:jg6319 [Pararge aegeria aegeria]|uniref:Jg6319 protein n=1 Tax=Pararge aegeria aegeria TaxID=348720 RepID=A0A8S4RBP0_9NEOP|nr:jg6319 [Pararge aegeria aegeria]